MSEGTFQTQTREDVFGAKALGNLVEIIHEWFLRFGTLCLSISIVAIGIDIASGDGLSALFPNASLVISFVLVAGIEAQLFILWRRAVLAHERTAYFTMFLWGLFAVVMNIYIGEMMTVWTLEHQLHFPEARALAFLHMPIEIWVIQRGVLGAVMAMTSAITIVAKPPVRVETTEEKVAKIEAEAAITRAQASHAAAQAELERANLAGHVNNADLRLAKQQADLHKMGAAAITIRNGAIAAINGRSVENAPIVNAPTTLTERALTRTSLELGATEDDSDPLPPTTPPTEPRRRGRPRKSSIVAGNNGDIQYVSRDGGVSSSPFTSRGGAGRPKRYDHNRKRVVAHVKDLLVEAEGKSIFGERVHVTPSSLMRDPWFAQEEIPAPPYYAKAKEILTEAKQMLEVERLSQAA